MLAMQAQPHVLGGGSGQAARFAHRRCLGRETRPGCVQTRVHTPHAPRAAPQITGPTSSSEFKLSILPADKYRPFSPGSPPVKVIVPHGRPETTFDIKYFTRERRRVHLPAINTGARKHLLVDARAEATISPAPVPGTRAPFQRLSGAGSTRIVPLLDEVNNGYT